MLHYCKFATLKKTHCDNYSKDLYFQQILPISKIKILQYNPFVLVHVNYSGVVICVDMQG